jgi:hypothetical protein
MILIHFLLIFTESETFQQTSQIILQSYSDSAMNHFSVETETFMFLMLSQAITIHQGECNSKQAVAVSKRIPL